MTHYRHNIYLWLHHRISWSIRIYITLLDAAMQGGIEFNEFGRNGYPKFWAFLFWELFHRQGIQISLSRDYSIRAHKYFLILLVSPNYKQRLL